MKGLLFFFIFLVHLSVAAQRLCTNTNSAETLKKQFVPLSNANETLGADTLSNQIIYVPVVVHVLYNNQDQNISDAQIISQMISLNNDFSFNNTDKINIPIAFKNLAADTKIKFCLAKIDPQNKNTNGIIRKYSPTQSFKQDDAMKFSKSFGDDGWDSKKYLNIWVCNLQGKALGYTINTATQAELDGIVINSDVFGTIGKLRLGFDKGRTLTHEVGHWLGLSHIWGDKTCGSDGVEDTPTQYSYNYGCPSFPKVSTCSPNTNGDMFMNYMDLTDDVCMNMFTYGQKNKMRAMFAKNGLRNSFLLASACDSVAVAIPPTINPVTTKFKISIYPNPAQTTINIICDNSVETSIEIFDLLGVKMMELTTKKGTTNINISTLKKGVYIVKLNSKNEKTALKFIKS
jgi:Secretion system C-terminal sorting domain/Pregnancy-associated plasma protein-A